MSDTKYQDSDKQALEHFKEYLRIPSVQPDINYGLFTYLWVLYLSWFLALVRYNWVHMLT